MIWKKWSPYDQTHVTIKRVILTRLQYKTHKNFLTALIPHESKQKPQSPEPARDNKLTCHNDQFRNFYYGVLLYACASALKQENAADQCATVARRWQSPVSVAVLICEVLTVANLRSAGFAKITNGHIRAAQKRVRRFLVWIWICFSRRSQRSIRRP